MSLAQSLQDQQPPAGTFNNLQEASITFKNLQQPAGTFSNQQRARRKMKNEPNADPIGATRHPVNQAGPGARPAGNLRPAFPCSRKFRAGCAPERANSNPSEPTGNLQQPSKTCSNLQESSAPRSREKSETNPRDGSRSACRLAPALRKMPPTSETFPNLPISHDPSQQHPLNLNSAAARQRATWPISPPPRCLRRRDSAGLFPATAHPVNHRFPLSLDWTKLPDLPKLSGGPETHFVPAGSDRYTDCHGSDAMDLTHADVIKRVLAESNVSADRVLAVLFGTLVDRHIDCEKKKRALRFVPIPNPRPDSLNAVLDALHQAKSINERIAASQAADGMESDPNVSDDAFISGMISGDLARVQQVLMRMLMECQIVGERAADLEEWEEANMGEEDDPEAHGGPEDPDDRPPMRLADY
jgi:hypothetical protein